MKVELYDLKDDIRDIKYVVIQARYQGEWIFVRHRDRTTWEIPGGHIELNETTDEAAKRELWEESGAQEFELRPICDYAVIRGDVKSFGRLYFAEVKIMGSLPEHEIAEVSFGKEMPKDLTYQEIQPYLFNKVEQVIK